MKKIVKLTESDLNRLVEKVLKEQEVADYMFFSNLQQIKRQCEILLEMDPQQIDEIINEGGGEVEGFNSKISELENLIKLATDKVSPLREKNIENLSRIQRLNLELQSLDEENTRIQDEIESIKKSISS